MAILIQPDGTESKVLPTDGRSFTLEEMQAFVGGYIEMLFIGESIYVINEDGKQLGLPHNPAATCLVLRHLRQYDYLCGPVLVCADSEVE
jgi:hypothetical protein